MLRRSFLLARILPTCHLLPFQASWVPMAGNVHPSEAIRTLGPTYPATTQDSGLKVSSGFRQRVPKRLSEVNGPHRSRTAHVLARALSLLNLSTGVPSISPIFGEGVLEVELRG